MYKFNKKAIAFTLAEVLMVLGIIGVVATITLPNLGDSTDQQVNVAKAKKIYSELSTSWDKYTLRHDVASNITATALVNAINTNLKVKGKSYIYKIDVPACTTNTECLNIATLLPDGSTYSAVSRSSSQYSYYNIYFDVDGPNKGDNTFGSDIFAASITFRSGVAETPSLEPFLQTDSLKTLSSIMVTGGAVSKDDGLLWILTNDNMDFNNCTVSWVNKLTCN